MQEEISKETVDALAPQGGKAVFLWDTRYAGFGVKVTPAGKKVYILQYRLPGEGRRVAPKRFTIGKHGEITAGEARKRAKKLLAEIGGGEDPRRRRRQDEGEAVAPTVADLAHRFLEEYLPSKKRPPGAKTRKDYVSIFKCHVLPKLKDRTVADVTEGDIEALHQHMRHMPYQANRLLSVLHQAFNQAERWGWRPAGSNPTRHIDRYTEERRGARKEVMLSPEQMKSLLEAIDKAEADEVDPVACAVIRFAFWTGWRISEVLRLRWENVDRATGRARLLKTKTSAEEYRMLPGEALEILDGLEPIEVSPWVFSGKIAGTHLTTVRYVWREVCETAELDHLDGLGALRLHDLRHNVVSWDVSRGISLEIAGKNVGHRSRQATEIYAHFAPDALKQAADERAAAMRRAVKEAKTLDSSGAVV